MAIVKRTLCALLAVVLLCGFAPVALADTVDTSVKVYDYVNLLTDAEEAELSARANEISREYSAHIVIVTCEGNTEDNLMYYSDAFYDNFLGVDGTDDCVMLTVDMTARKVRIDVFGTMGQESRYESGPLGPGKRDSMINQLSPWLTNQQYRDAFRYFLDETAASLNSYRMISTLEVPTANPAYQVHDYGQLFSEEQEAWLRELCAGYRQQYDTSFIVSVCNTGNEDLLDTYRGRFYQQEMSVAGSAIMLTLDVGLGRVVIDTYGMANNKVSWDDRYEAEKAAQTYLSAGDAMGACIAGLYQMSECMNSWIPKSQMRTDFSRMLGIGAVAGLALGLLAVLVMVGMQRKMGSRVGARMYMKADGLELLYSRDVFVGSHTTKSRRVKNEDSGSGGGSSTSNGPRSSGSQGSF